MASRPRKKAQEGTNYQAALDYAWELFKKTDLRLQVERCGGRPVYGEWKGEREETEEEQKGIGDSFCGKPSGIEIRFMDLRYLISVDETDVFSADGKEVPIHYKILILHLFLYHNGGEPTGRWISFLDIKDGLLYANIYRARTSLPLGFALKKDPGLLTEAAKHLGGKGADISDIGGDVSALFEPFHKIPIAVVYWRGDDEFPPEVSFLFDGGIRNILPAEDVVVLAESLGREIRRYIREKGG
jgi:hypothetical protein